MNWVSVLLAGASLAQSNAPFTETFGPTGEQKTISSGYVDCSGRTLDQTKATMYELSQATTNDAARYILKSNQCTFIEHEGDTLIIDAVRDQRCIILDKAKKQTYCDFEYFVFELRPTKGKRFFAVYAPIYE